MAGESQQLPDSAPDPSVLTTEAIGRAARAERDYVDGEIRVLKQRLDDMDEATKVLNETVTRTPTEIQKQVGHLKELHDEKFQSVALQFLERDTRSERESRDNKTAVDAAFAAQKEASAKQDEANQKAIDKSERGVLSDIIKLTELFRTTTDALAQQMGEIKERVGRIESIKVGGQESKAALYAAAAFIATVIGIIAYVLASPH